MGRGPIDLTGQRFGGLVVLELREDNGKRFWRCRCDCGKETIVSTSNLRSGNTRSCGDKGCKAQYDPKPLSLCWGCQNATGGCCWSARLEPVPGWDAVATTINSSPHDPFCSFLVRACPLFAPD